VKKVVNNEIMSEYVAEKFITTIKRIAAKTVEWGKYAGEDTPAGRLSFSELNLITLIGEFKDIKVTDLAVKYGVTKGAISKMVKSLAKKNLVEKRRTAENEKEVLLSLTNLGMAVYSEKEAHLQEFYREVQVQLKDLPDEQVETFLGILTTIETHIDGHLTEQPDGSE
jgi:Transcriptional regulators